MDDSSPLDIYPLFCTKVKKENTNRETKDKKNPFPKGTALDDHFFFHLLHDLFQVLNRKISSKWSKMLNQFLAKPAGSCPSFPPEELIRCCFYYFIYSE